MLYKVKTVAEILNISESSVITLLNTNVLKGFKIGRVWRIDSNDLEEFLDAVRLDSDEMEGIE